jgi:hypothetical protein
LIYYLKVKTIAFFYESTIQEGYVCTSPTNTISW